jgi:hypothetical protein
MTEEEKAKIILEALDEYIQVDWNFEKYYLKAIENGLKEIERREQNGELTAETLAKRTGA